MYFEKRADLLVYLRGLLPQYLAMRQINVGTGYFKCINPKHNDTGFSMYYDAQSKTIRCLGCKCTYDLLAVIGLDYGILDSDLCFDKACEIFHFAFDCNLGRWCDSKDLANTKARNIVDFPPKTETYDIKKNRYVSKLSDYFHECASRLATTDFLINLGIELNLAKQYNIGYDPEFRTREGSFCSAIIIPVAPEAFVAIDTNIGNDLGRHAVGGQHIFGNKIVGSNSVFVVQNELDALILLNSGFSAYCIANISALNELQISLESCKADTIYLVSSEDETDPEIYAAICDSLSDNESNLSNIDLSFPYVSLREFVQRGSEKLIQRIDNLNDILKPRTKPLQLCRNVIQHVDKQQFIELELEPAIYGVEAKASLRRNLIAHWLLATENRFIYCTSFGDWQIFSMIMSERIKKYGSGYSSRLSKISLYELGLNAEKDANEILQCLLGQRVKLQKESIILLNLTARNSSYIFELMRNLCSGMRQYNLTIMLFDSGIKDRSLDEFCGTLVHLSNADNRDDDNPYESSAVKLKFTDLYGNTSEEYIALEEFI